MRNESAFGVELNYLRQWIDQNSKFIIINCFILCYLYSAWIFSRAPLVDTMLYINIPSSSYNWLSIGREGAVFSKWLFQNMNYNPYLATGIGYIFICIGGILFGYIGYRCSGKGGCLWSFTPAMFLCPIFAEQFYFKLQILEIGWGYILCASAVALNYFIIFKKKRMLYFFSIMMMIWSFHTYQTFVITYAVMVGIAYILLCLSGKLHEERKDITWCKLLIEHIAVFGIANVAGQIFTSMFFTSSGYLESTMLWQSGSIEICIDNINSHMKTVFLGYGERVFFSMFYGILALIVVILILMKLLKNRKAHSFIMFLSTVCIQFSPLLITIYTGSLPSIRGQLIYPLVMIFDGFISFIAIGEFEIKWRKFAQFAIALVMVIALWQQLSVTMRLIYTNEIRADEDIRLAQALDTRLMEMDAANKPVAFVGGYDNVLNSACIRGEMIGQSAFSMFTDSEPHYSVSTWHTCSVMNTMGIHRLQADNGQMEYARRVAVNMPIWPARDSVLDVGDFVIVKLGAEEWAEEILKTELSPINGAHIQYEDDLTVSIESVKFDGSKVLITGWCFKEGISPYDFIPKVCLKHNGNGQFWMLEASAVRRTELVQYWGNSYQNSGFIAKTDVEELEAPLDEYSVYVGFEKEGTYYLMEMLHDLTQS